jgi:hypothetical protein
MLARALGGAMMQVRLRLQGTVVSMRAEKRIHGSDQQSRLPGVRPR